MTTAETWKAQLLAEGLTETAAAVQDCIEFNRDLADRLKGTV